MGEIANYRYYNIRRLLDDPEIGEEVVKEMLSSFQCPMNPDVETFLKVNAIEFTKKSQSVTYLVMSEAGDMDLLGYFTLAIKPLSIRDRESFSNNMKKRISRTSELDKDSNTYSTSAYLIAQLGKNYSNEISHHIGGKDLLASAIQAIREMQYRAGGNIVFLEAEEKEKLMQFYESKENGFIRFDERQVAQGKNEGLELIQMMKLI